MLYQHSNNFLPSFQQTLQYQEEVFYKTFPAARAAREAELEFWRQTYENASLHGGNGFQITSWLPTPDLQLSSVSSPDSYYSPVQEQYSPSLSITSTLPPLTPPPLLQPTLPAPIVKSESPEQVLSDSHPSPQVPPSRRHSQARSHHRHSPKSARHAHKSAASHDNTSSSSTTWSITSAESPPPGATRRSRRSITPTGKRHPDKKLALACVFCRGRKIACGPPPKDGDGVSCNQCHRRSLCCVYPTESRRGMRKKSTSLSINPNAPQVVIKKTRQ